jgi:hypothetical protein
MGSLSVGDKIAAIDGARRRWPQLVELIGLDRDVTARRDLVPGHDVVASTWDSASPKRISRTSIAGQWSPS